MTVTDEVTGAVEDNARRHPLRRLHDRLHANPVLGLITKIVLTIVGVVVLCAGLVMMVTPGPGIVGIIVGLAILALEWDWAERWMHSAKAKARAAAEKARNADPAVRRRRLLAGLAVAVLVAGGVWAYVAAYDWPMVAVDGWDWVQGLHSAVPELPGM